MPVASVVCTAPVMLPPPFTFWNVITTPATGLLLPSKAIAQTGAGTAVPGAAICEFPVEMAIRVATPEAADATPVAVAVNVTEFNPADVQVTVFVPAVGPNVQPPSVAIPLAPVVWLAPVIDPPPVTLPQVTATPGTPAPVPSIAITQTGPFTAVPAVALWPSPVAIASVVGAPAAQAAPHEAARTRKTRRTDCENCIYGPSYLSFIVNDSGKRRDSLKMAAVPERVTRGRSI
jgi:hypothetical protein